MSKNERIFRQAAMDAEILLRWWFSGLPIGRDSAFKAGMPYRRWGWAVGFLRWCCIITKSDVRVMVESLPIALEKLERKRGVEPTDDVYQKLIDFNAWV